MDIKKVETAIGLINDFKDKIGEALNGEVMLSIKIDKVLTELVIGMERSIGTLGTNTSTKFKPLKGMLDFGDVSKKQERVLDYRSISETEKLDFERSVEGLYKSFNDLKTDEIMHSPDRLIILGVAKKAGVAVTEKTQITEVFIGKIRKGIIETNASIKEKEDRKAYDKL